MTALYISIAGALGSVSRYALSNVLGRAMDPSKFPLGTFVVNLLGSLLMGLVIGIFAARGDADTRLRLLLSVGFLGGFTTYSSFALETVGLLEQRQVSTASAYVGLTLVSAGLACFLGLILGRRI